MQYTAVIFDLDGTLLNTLGDLADAMNIVLEEAGFPPHPHETYKYFVGDGVVKLVERALPPVARDEHTMRECVAAFRGEYARRWDATTAPYEGVAAMLAALGERGVGTAVLSNKPHEYTVKCVERYFPDAAFGAVQGVCEGVPPKPDPAGALAVAERIAADPGAVVYVGDTNTDMETATAAGFFPLGATWGFRTPAELLAHGARELVDAPGDIVERFFD